MLKRYLERQQKVLESIGNEKIKSEQERQRQLERLKSLNTFDAHLSEVNSGNALIHQNRLALRHQLENLLVTQQQETDLAQLDWLHQQQQLLRQFGKVKGLELNQKKRAELARAKGLKQEQRELDEWLNARVHTRRRAPD
ncbi:flagellar protein [Gallaecimonas mangrovi]|uniref:flagellar protein n=1 Tax=Gallaecimonas mangrovi TaxID=2291597 RepID=UPI000E201701|nr:flagellar protein [Gallaecimonas mangrovi]